ncbi:MAG TPA: DUF305 domain-containing protein [Miltoncostaeaceae bacterium]|nr:DUF305 domain-containing protein [Miltoncostaeaceae bacterium]
MNNRLLTLIVVGVVALGAGLGIGAAVWAGGDHGGGSTGHSSNGMMDSSDDTLMMTTGPLDERSFMEQMVPHHESAIAMATLALEKARRPEVRRLAQQIIDAQGTEVAEMRDWHREWFGSELRPSSEGPHASMDMGPLEEATGEDFDRAFLRMMISHHASAIMMAEAVMMDEPRTQVGDLASEVVAAQAAEIGQMQRWRQQWFPPLG